VNAALEDVWYDDHHGFESFRIDAVYEAPPTLQLRLGAGAEVARVTYVRQKPHFNRHSLLRII
jgi:hypothetical protein